MILVILTIITPVNMGGGGGVVIRHNADLFISEVGEYLVMSHGF